MSSPPGGGRPPASGADTTADDPPTRRSGTRLIPGPRLRRAGLVLPRRPAAARPAPARLVPDRYLRRARPLRGTAVSSALAALALAGCGVLILQLVHRQTGTVGLLVGMGLALLPLPFVLGALAWLNQTGRVPLRHTLFCLAWGACAATTVAIMANGWASDFLIAHQGSARGETLGAEFATPLIEETAKGAALLLLMLPVRRRLRCRAERGYAVLARRSPAALRLGTLRLGGLRLGGLRLGALQLGALQLGALRLGSLRLGSLRLGARGWRPAGRPRPAPHLRARPYPRAHPRSRARAHPRTLAAGVVLGGVTACGFAFTENALYLGRAFTDDQQARLDGIGLGETPSLRDFDSTVHTFVLRGLLSPFAHPLFTALTGLGLAVALTTGRRWLARTAGPLGLLLAMALHGTWNAAAGLGTHGFLLVYAALMVPCFAALVCFAAWARSRTARHAQRRPQPRPAHPAG